MLINGLPLPTQLFALIDSNRWRIPSDADAEKWQRFWNHFVAFNGPYPQVHFFQPADMEEMTSLLSQDYFGVNLKPEWEGSISRLHSVFAVDPDHSIVIGDLLHRPKNPDKLCAPIVLDYRQSLENPKVIYFPDDPFESYWCEIAPSFNELAIGLGL